MIVNGNDGGYVEHVNVFSNVPCDDDKEIPQKKIGTNPKFVG